MNLGYLNVVITTLPHYVNAFSIFKENSHEI